MDFQIRQAITANVLGSDATEFKDIVNDAISRGEEHLLPGLGVFLETWWQASNEDERTHFVEKLAEKFAN
ncbi:small acid-soluble spore protein SspI [Solibacillus sp. MA9]|uniref:Small, acid-soluble spore protein I n=1 Tax=Solibacillus palustris TaxID=2908203 RepID=A0ABS9UDD7_9BACL|nr:small acid-soluble spore protein SspI [Solibacillus sp. MA9]MCH7322342.1 small acid-soluble spore protein SspI [Solibacillus sp. MA9]